VLDHRGRPKLAYHHLRRALAPVTVWSTDEGLSGVVAHVANDRAEPLEATLRVALYRSSEVRVAEARVDVSLEPHSGCEHNVERVVGRFVDASWSYRFGPPAQDLVVLSLERPDDDGGRPLSQAIRHPAGRPSGIESAAALGLSAVVEREGETGWALRLQTRRFVYGCRPVVPGFMPEDDGFSLEPGYTRCVRLTTHDPHAEPAGALSATNLDGQVRLGMEAGA
jgi:beta-mannosidase